MKTITQFPEFITRFQQAMMPPGVGGVTNFLGNNEGQVAFHTIPEGQRVPLHEHKDSWAILVDGQLEISLGDKQFTVGPGESWFIPEGVMHGGLALKDALLVEVFCEQRFTGQNP